jgi:hypothetical protein
MELEKAVNNIAIDVEFARVVLQGDLVAEIIPTTVEVCTNAEIGLDEIGAEDL